MKQLKVVRRGISKNTPIKLMKKQESRGWKETIELEQDTKSEQKERTNQESHGRNIPVDLEAIPSRAA